jgi:membrane protein implicated in regulation of membrane protease activity
MASPVAVGGENMLLIAIAVCLLLILVVLAIVAGVGIVAALAALLVAAAMLGALAAIAVLLAARHADTVRRRSSRTQVLSDIRMVEARLAGNERG